MVGGTAVTSACANHMNPPLSYTDPTMVGTVEVVSGVTPVSKGGDSIAGSVFIEPPAPRFAGQEGAPRTSGAVHVLQQQQQRLWRLRQRRGGDPELLCEYTGAWSKAGDYTAAAPTP